MNTRVILCLLAIAGIARAGDTASPALPATGDAIDIVKRSLPFVQEKGAAWIEDRHCASCHQIPSMLWSQNSAARLGLELDRKALAERTAWSVDWTHWNQTGAKDGVDKVSAGNSPTMVFLLLGRDPGADKDAEWMRDFRAQILKNQQQDGSWKPQGQMPSNRRPAREITEVVTMWTLLALNTYAGETLAAEVKQRADAFLAAAKTGISTEWFATRLLLQPDNKDLNAELLKQQHADGGWGWLVADPSDAFGTGLALYALARSGVPPTAEPVKRATAWLKSTQQPNGSWLVPSTRTNDKCKVIPTSTYWGTAWAVIGLLETQMPGSQITAR